VKTYEAIVKGENVMEPGVPESFKVLIKELQSLALDVKVLTESREEVEIKTADDEMGESERREFGLLMGDESNAVSQTQVAAREAVAEAVAEGAIEGAVADVEVEPEEEEEEELDDSKPLDASVPIPVVPPLPRGAEPEDIFVVEEETAADDDLEGPQGYELEEEEEEVYEEDRPSYAEDEEPDPAFPEPANVAEEEY
jgi:hypothetical protein